jgi:hypothetical protein
MNLNTAHERGSKEIAQNLDVPSNNPLVRTTKSSYT